MKKGQLAQLVQESDLFFRVKRQIKTLLINVMAEHVKSRMSNAKQGNGESVVHDKPEYADVQSYDVLLILYTSRVLSIMPNRPVRDQWEFPSKMEWHFPIKPAQAKQ